MNYRLISSAPLGSRAISTLTGADPFGWITPTESPCVLIRRDVGLQIVAGLQDADAVGVALDDADIRNVAGAELALEHLVVGADLERAGVVAAAGRRGQFGRGPQAAGPGRGAGLRAAADIGFGATGSAT